MPQVKKLCATPTVEATLWALVAASFSYLAEPHLWLAQDLLDAAVQGALDALQADAHGD